MKVFSEKSGGQFLLLLLAGFYFTITLCMQFRNVLAGSESAILGVGVALTFIALWCYLGSMAIPYSWLENRGWHSRALAMAVIMLPTAALLTVLIARLTILLPENAHAGLHLVNIAMMTLPLGLWGGGLLALLHGDTSRTARGLNTIGLALGICAGGVVTALAVERALWGEQLLLLAGIPVILWALASGCRSLRNGRERLKLLVFGAWIMVFGLLFFYSAGLILQKERDVRLPGWTHFRSIELPVGRMSFFREKQDGARPGYRIYLNRRLMWALPEDAGLYVSSLMPVMLQSMQPNQRVLVVAPPFYDGLSLLAAMPQVGQVDVLCPYQSLFEFSRGNGLLGELPKTTYFAVDPLRFLGMMESEYHAIVVLDPLLVESRSERDFIALAGMKLAPNGVFAMPMPLTDNSLRKYFPYTDRVPGCRKMVMGSRRPLFTDVAVLGKILDDFLRAFNITTFFPPGTFEVLYSHSERPAISWRERESVNSMSGLSLASPRLACWQIAILGVTLGGYFWIRFLGTRHGNNALKFAALENGICGAGFFYLAIILFEWHGLMLYQQLGILLAAGGIVLLGELLPLRPSLRILVTAVSCLLPLAIFYRGGAEGAMLIAGVAWMNLSLGQVNYELDRRRTILGPAELLKWFHGGIFYGFAGILIFLCVANLLICCIVLTVLRLFALGMMLGARK